MKTLRVVVILASAVVASACGDSKPVSYSQPVDITLPALSSKNVTPFSTTKDISTAGSNPYGGFVNNAVQHLGGKNPSHVVITSLTLSMTTTPAGLTFDQVFSGTLAVSFDMNGSGTLYPVGTTAGPSGVGPVSLTVAFDSSTMTAADYSAFLQGQFKVVVAGTAASAFSGSATTETATVDATFGFVAYE